MEWLSDWSFNVVFQDPEEAKNAAAAKSFGLPEVLPREIAVRSFFSHCQYYPTLFPSNFRPSRVGAVA